MSAAQRPQRTFLAVTLITVIAVASVFMVYALLLATLWGGPVSIVGVKGTVKYDENNSANDADWDTTLGNRGPTESWYAMFNTTGTGYAGSVWVYWTLYNETSPGTWTPVPGATFNSTTVTLSGNIGDEIYATTTGARSGNLDWGTYTTSVGTYKIKAEINK